MEKYVICMDASGDLTLEDAKQYDIKFVPMQYSLGEEMRVCEGIENPEILKKFYDGQRKGDFTKTSQITPFMYEEYFDEYMKEGYSVLYIALSSGLSSTYNAACMAKATLKEKYPDVDLYPVDSKSATGGIGILIDRAGKNKAKGLSVEENYNDLLSVISNVSCYLMVQDLMYLKRGGRVSPTTAVVGTMLGIKPILMINKEGKLDTISKKHGNKKAASYLVELFMKDFDETKGDTIYVCHADSIDLADSIETQVHNAYPSLNVKKAMLSPIIGAHTGPGMAIICYFSK